jgi:hypothetical protein
MTEEPDAPAPASKPGEILVFIIRRDAVCAECGVELGKGRWIRLVEGKPLCLTCADLDHLAYLQRGDVAVTRRATKYSPIRAIVLQWSRAGQRYERQGIMVTAEAIARAEEECLSDADYREQQRIREGLRRVERDAAYVKEMTEALRAQFPKCPKKEAGEIAEWACEKHSGRIGRSSAAKGFDPQALKLAVIAHIRHEHTPYDALLMKHDDRAGARRQVREEVERVLAKWEGKG